MGRPCSNQARKQTLRGNNVFVLQPFLSLALVFLEITPSPKLCRTDTFRNKNADYDEKVEWRYVIVMAVNRERDRIIPRKKFVYLAEHVYKQMSSDMRNVSKQKKMCSHRAICGIINI